MDTKSLKTLNLMTLNSWKPFQIPNRKFQNQTIKFKIKFWSKQMIK